MNHRYIDETSVAERYLEHRLGPDERAEFEAHLQGCDECSDRVLLAQLFLDKQKQESRSGHGSDTEQIGLRENGRSKGTYSIFTEPVIPIPSAEEIVGLRREALPWTAQFVAQFKPWQLALILAVGAALLLLAPVAYLFWELAKLQAAR
jgi:hypothetical protein